LNDLNDNPKNEEELVVKPNKRIHTQSPLRENKEYSKSNNNQFSKTGNKEYNIKNKYNQQ